MGKTLNYNIGKQRMVENIGLIDTVEREVYKNLDDSAYNTMWNHMDELDDLITAERE